MLSTATKVGERVLARCAITGKVIEGTVIWSGPSSTPYCWRIDIRPDPGTHPVSPRDCGLGSEKDRGAARVRAMCCDAPSGILPRGT